MWVKSLEHLNRWVLENVGNEVSTRLINPHDLYVRLLHHEPGWSDCLTVSVMVNVTDNPLTVVMHTALRMDAAIAERLGVVQ